jgi:hypothetical protein
MHQHGMTHHRRAFRRGERLTYNLFEENIQMWGINRAKPLVHTLLP